ncbi:YfaZ family outer membrane protein [Hahella sp. SMD15-11]|uniref:YfaZ family outer membrane protein n=1 Tax=Thermohahella caldifontis TaxID=3142973 RepID=A0AB39UZC7_9GAMM
MKRIVLCLLCLTGTVATANELDTALSNDAVNLDLTLSGVGRNIDLNFGYLYHEGSRHLVTAGMHARGQTALGNLPTTVTLGGMIHYASDSPFEGTALALGGSAHIKIPDVPGLGVRTTLYYAPAITSFGDADGLFRFELRGTYRVIRNADVFLGYRTIEFDTEGKQDLNVDEGLFAGLSIKF